MSICYKKILEDKLSVFFVGLLIFTSSILIMALTIDHYLGYEPCILCLYERIPYFLMALFSLASFFLSRNKKILLLQTLCILAFIGAGIAIYHVGVEKAWWDPSTKCIPDTNFSDIISFDDFKNKLESAKLGDCSKPALKILWFSLADINVILNLFMAAIFILILRKNAKAKF